MGDAPFRGPLHIFGAGGSGREVAWLAEECGIARERLTFVVDSPRYLREPVNDIPVRLLSDLDGTASYVAAVGDPPGREHCVAAATNAGWSPATLVHPRSERSPLVRIGAGSIVCAGSVLTTNVILGEHVHVNIGCTVSHDVVLDDFVTLSPGVHIAGYVHVGRGAFLGIGAVIINGDPRNPLLIGERAVIAAGACVTKTVEPHSMVAGVPAVRKK